MSVTLCMYVGRGTIGNAIIRWWTNSEQSHCELLLSDGYCYSSSVRDGGVRRKRIELSSKNWLQVPVPWASELAIRHYYDKTKNNRYGWLDIVRSQVFNRRSNQATADFCSEWCADALGIPDPTMHSPNSLYNLVKWRNKQ